MRLHLCELFSVLCETKCVKLANAAKVERHLMKQVRIYIAIKGKNNLQKMAVFVNLNCLTKGPNSYVRK